MQSDIFKQLSSGLKFSKTSELKENVQEAQAVGRIDFFSKKRPRSTSNNTTNKKPKTQSESETPVGPPPSTTSTAPEPVTLEQTQVLYKNHKIKAWGNEVPPPIQSWSEYQNNLTGLSFLVKNIQAAGYTQPSPVQMQAIPSIIARREVIVAAPTGSGKTASYTIPILHNLKKPSKNGIRVVIVLPTNELAGQVYNEFLKLSAGKTFKICLLQKTDIKLTNFDIIISTPKRLIHVIQNGLSLTTVESLILDECDTLLSEGFLPQIDEIVSACSNTNLLVSLFSATISTGVEDLAKSFMKDPIRIIIGAKNTVVEEVDQKLIYTGNEEGKLVALRRKIREGVKPPVLIFVQSKVRAEELFREFVYENLNVDIITGDRTTAQRERTTQQFREGKIWFLIATNLMARGMDFKGVHLVINFDLPTNPTDYIHRVGRTGRMGRKGTAETYYTDDDIPYLRQIVNLIKASGKDVPAWLLNIRKIPKKDMKRLAKNPVKRDHVLHDPKLLARNEVKKKQKAEEK